MTSHPFSTTVRIALVAGTALLGVMTAQASAANLLINGGFEASTSQYVTPPGWMNIGHQDGVISYSLFNTPAYEGSYFYDLGGFGDPQPPAGDGIEQTVATVVGQKYTLTFGLSSENENVNPLQSLIVSVGSQKSQFLLNYNPAYGELGKPFSTETLSYIATGTSTTIAFILDPNYSNTGYNDPMIDGVSFSASSVSGVPLPASAPMFGAALLALGAVGYGVKRKKAAAAA